MITLQHSLVTLLFMEGDMERFKKSISYILLPDGIRAWTGARPYSHFEESSDGKEASWMEFPKDLKNFKKENVDNMSRYLSSNIIPCCIGENSNIEVFKKHNTHLPLDYYNGVFMHLKQDIIFDNFIRTIIDCSNKYEDSFVYNGEYLNGQELRKFIAQLEMDGVLLLAKLCYEKFGILTNQKWFEENVYSMLKEYYPEELANNTYKYMTISEEVESKINNKDFTYLGLIPEKDMIRMYEEVLSSI